MLRIKKRVIPEILNLSTVLGVKGNEAGEKADFIEQNDTAVTSEKGLGFEHWAKVFNLSYT